MPKSPNDKLQGTLTLLVLRTLHARGPLHGYGLSEHIRSVSDEMLQVEEGSLYPALHRMEQDQWISSKWEITDKGRKAKFYSITAKGRKQLAEENESWERLTEGVTRVLKYS
jgi:transcriptional regulator